MITILFSGGPWVTPPNLRSTIKAETFSTISPLFSSFTGVFAKTVNISAIPPLEIQILAPFNIQCLPSGESSALVLIEFASDPDDGSVNANAAKSSPDAKRGKYFAFCSGDPAIKIPLNPID